MSNKQTKENLGDKDLENKIKGYSDIPLLAFSEIVKRLSESKLENGGKYERDNHLKSIKNTDLIDSIFRHSIAYLSGEDMDKDTTTSHLTAIAVNAILLEEQRLRNTLIDNRLKYD